MTCPTCALCNFVQNVAQLCAFSNSQKRACTSSKCEGYWWVVGGDAEFPRCVITHQLLLRSVLQRDVIKRGYSKQSSYDIMSNITHVQKLIPELTGWNHRLHYLEQPVFERHWCDVVSTQRVSCCDQSVLRSLYLCTGIQKRSCK